MDVQGCVVLRAVLLKQHEGFLIQPVFWKLQATDSILYQLHHGGPFHPLSLADLSSLDVCCLPWTVNQQQSVNVSGVARFFTLMSRPRAGMFHCSLNALRRKQPSCPEEKPNMHSRSKKQDKRLFVCCVCVLL